MRTYSANRRRRSVADGTKREEGVTAVGAGTVAKRNGVQPGRVAGDKFGVVYGVTVGQAKLVGVFASYHFEPDRGLDTTRVML